MTYKRRSTVEEEVRPPEEWRDVPGFDGRYQASSYGNIRRMTPKGWAANAQGRCGGKKLLFVDVCRPDGHRMKISVLRMVALAFFGDRCEGMYAVHRNGYHGDNSVWNIELVTPEEMGQRNGRTSRRRPVTARRGEDVLRYFPSAAEAARYYGISRDAVRRSCGGKYVATGLGGLRFEWDD